MYRQLTCELRKLLTGRIAAILAILLVANLVSLYFDTQDSVEESERLAPYADAFRRLEEVCSADPEYYAAYYQELKEDQRRAYEEFEANTPIFPPINEDGTVVEFVFEYTSPSTLVDGYQDWEIFDLYDSFLSDYRNQLSDSVTSAEKNLATMEKFGISTDNETGNYQRNLIKLYSGILEKNAETPSIARGWNELLTYENHLIFLILAALLLAVQMGQADRESGVEPVLRVCRKGRWQPALAKCGALVIAIAGSAALLTLSEIAFVGIRFGISSPLRAVQNLSAYVYAPYAISILETLLLNLAGMILTSAVFGGIALLLTALTRQVILPLIVGGLLTTVNLLLHWIPMLGDWRYFNAIEPASGRTLMRPPVISLMGLGNSLYPLLEAALAGILCVIVIGTVLSYAFRRPTERTKKASKLLSALTKPFKRKSTARKPAKIHVPTLMGGELRKWASPLLIVAILFLTAVRVNQTTERFDPAKNDVEQRMSAYVDRFGGIVTDETVAAVDAELSRAIYLTSQDTQQEYMKNYAMGRISADEYFAYQQESAKAASALPVLSELAGHISYLREKSAETGLATEFFYDYGYTDFFGQELDLPLYLLILLGLSAVFAKEYAGESSKGGFVQILRTTPRGRAPVFLRKLLWAAIYAGELSLSFSLLDVLLLNRASGLPGLNAPLCSMERYANAAFGITVGQYLVLCIGMRLLASLLLSLLTASFSCLLRNTKLVLAIAAFVTMLPYALYYFGIQIARYFDFTAFLSGDRLWLTSLEQGSLAFLLAFTAAATALTASLAALSYRRFCK